VTTITAELWELLLAATGTTAAIDAAQEAGDAVHAIIKQQATSMPTVSSAIAVGMLVAAQIYLETIEFARLSMDGDADDAATIKGACEILFAGLVAKP
jgi:phage-related tail fiber protein